MESDIYDDTTHFQKDQIIPFLEELTANEIILTNIGSFQDLTHEDLVKKLPSYTIAYDGMTGQLIVSMRQRLPDKTFAISKGVLRVIPTNLVLEDKVQQTAGALRVS